MDSKDMEVLVMELVVNGGNARYASLEAVRSARKGDFEAAGKLMAECDEVLGIAHNMQTDLIQKEAAGHHTEMNLFMVHAQDHLMNAMTVRDLSAEIIEILKEMKK